MYRSTQSVPKVIALAVGHCGALILCALVGLAADEAAAAVLALCVFAVGAAETILCCWYLAPDRIGCWTAIVVWDSCLTGLALVPILGPRGLDYSGYMVSLVTWYYAVPGAIAMAATVLLVRAVTYSFVVWPGSQHGCGRCGYNLTANVSGRCPECGTPVPPSAGSKPKESS